MTNLTHPDILKMERNGYLGKEPEPVGVCHYCRRDILPDDTHYGSDDCIVCDDYSCIMEYVERYKR